MQYFNIFLELLFLFVINKWQSNNKLLVDERIIWFFNGFFLSSILYSIVIKIMLFDIKAQIDYLKFLVEKTF